MFLDSRGYECSRSLCHHNHRECDKQQLWRECLAGLCVCEVMFGSCLFWKGLDLSLADDLMQFVRCIANVQKGDGSLELRTFVYLCDEEWLRLAAGIEGLLVVEL